MRRRTVKPRLLIVATAVTGLLAGAAAVPLSSSASPSLGNLNSQLSQVQAHEQGLASSIGSLGGLISSLDGQISLVESREAALRVDLARDQAKLAAVQGALRKEKKRLAILIARLAHSRMLLSRQLVSNYENSKPDIVSVVLEAHGFASLLDQLSYLKDAEQQQQQLITITKTAKAQATAAAKRLAGLQRTDSQITEQTGQRVDALAGMNALLHSREDALQKARVAREQALQAARDRGSQLQHQITKIQAEQAAAVAAAQDSTFPVATGQPSLGASGGWAIPWPIVLCESGGQNLTPNSAGASGYYQIIPSTWKLFGGPGPAAYMAPKSVQDEVASRIWNGGAGASNWVCAGIVGIH
jgi:septal ring factor EnvC (AmiA/AmiB activator)